MMGRLGLRIAFALACLAGSAPALADNDSIAAAGQLSEAELSEQRGGFRWQGLDINFGAEIRSYLNDRLVMQTNFSWGDTSVDVQRTVSSELTQATAADLQTGILAGGRLNVNAANQAVFLANQGQTAFIQRTDGAILNIIANTASNVELRQEIDARFNIAHFAPFRSEMLAGRIGAALSAVDVLALLRGTQN